MKVLVPSVFNRNTMYFLLESVINSDLTPKDDKIEFDFTKLNRFIEPVGVTILSNLFEWLEKHDVKVAINYPEDVSHVAPLKYLDDSMFFLRYLGKQIETDSRKRETTIPLEIVSYANSYQWLESTLINWLSYRLNVTKESLVEIKVCLSEIFNNIDDHADEQIGCIFVQHYPQKNEVNIAISDFGVGIPGRIQQTLPSLTDEEALLQAAKEGFTTKTTPRNRGAGLDTLITNVVDNNHGSVYIHSNKGILNCIYGNTPTITSEVANGYYPGTLFEIILKTDTIENIINDEEEFDWF